MCVRMCVRVCGCASQSLQSLRRRWCSVYSRASIFQNKKKEREGESEKEREGESEKEREGESEKEREGESEKTREREQERRERESVC